ncbi:MAG: EAL domain-containing protein [Lachnospiraceae bacterium]|nr:EAL domain-containing protein [Lachnospiraceae bacterium]
MILYYDVCAFIVLILVVMSCVLKKMFHGRTNGLFYLVLLVMAVATMADFATAYMQNFSEPNETNRSIEYMWHYIYFASHNAILPVYLPFVYSNIGMWHEFEKNKTVRTVWYASLIINIIVLFSNLIYPYVFYVNDRLVYERKSGIAVFYVTAALFMLFEIGVILKHRKIIRRDKLIVMILLFPLAITGIVIQAILPDHLVEMFMVSISILLFSLIIRREEEMLDPITGARKYSAAHDRVRNILATNTHVYILLLKIRNFRNIRMYLGQELFNRFLREQSVRLRSFAVYNSLDEEVYYLEDGLFAYISETTDFERIRKLAIQIKNHFSKTLTVESFSIMVDARICSVRCPDDIDNYNTLYTFCSTFDQILPDNHEMMNYADYVDDREFKIKSELDDIIDRALKYRSFKIFYQPIYSIVEKRFVSAEAFIRLRDEIYGMISPAMFIKAAEISGAIHAIGDFVLEDVCRFISENDFNRLGLECIEVNMSTSQCIEMNLVDKIAALIDKYQLSPSKLNLEITESAVDFDPDVVDQNISRLHEMGIHFALDDYGTGYSNVKRVTTLPVDIVKLDKSFVDGIDDPQMWIMVQGTIRMLKEMGKKVLVEGVEEEKVVEKFTDLGADYIQGCEYLQGYYFCRPLPERDFLEFMNWQTSGTI